MHRKKIVFSTSNEGKYLCLCSYIHKATDEVELIWDCAGQIQESDNVLENARNKAIVASSMWNIPVIATDEGLNLGFLPKSMQPGAYIRRCIGENASDEDIIRHYEGLIQKGHNNVAQGIIQTAYAIGFCGKTIATTQFEQKCIFTAPATDARIPGRPLASLEYVEIFKKHYADLSSEEILWLNNQGKSDLIDFIIKTINSIDI